MSTPFPRAFDKYSKGISSINFICESLVAVTCKLRSIWKPLIRSERMHTIDLNIALQFY